MCTDMAGISASLIATVLSMSLMASGTATPLQLKETDPVAVASLQANLDVLGFNAGAPNGHISASTYQAMTKFVTQFGQRSSEPINVQVAHIVRSLPDLGTHLSGASILAMQSWLARWRLYHGALNGQSSTVLIHAVPLSDRVWRQHSLINKAKIESGYSAIVAIFPRPVIGKHRRPDSDG